jgi:hypothetical protein
MNDQSVGFSKDTVSPTDVYPIMLFLIVAD